MRYNESDDERSDRESLEETFGPMEHVHLLIGGIPYRALAMRRREPQSPGIETVMFREPVGNPEDFQSDPDKTFYNIGTLMDAVWGDLERHPTTGLRVLRQYYNYSMPFSCPGCGGPVMADVRNLGQPVDCKECGLKSRLVMKPHPIDPSDIELVPVETERPGYPSPDAPVDPSQPPPSAT